MNAAHEFDSVCAEFDRPAARGFTMAGWNFSGDEIREAISGHSLLNPAVQLGTNACPWRCRFCFTEDPSNADGKKRRLATEMTLKQKLLLIRDLAALGCRSINFVGAGEPTIDPDFWTLIDAIRDADMVPIVYTEGSLRLQQPAFTQRLHATGATVVLKVNSLWNHEYQDSVVRGDAARTRRPQTSSYTAGRNRALEVLLSAGFANETPTRLAFDTIITRHNVHEIEELHRFTRKQNIFMLLVNYLPSGRSTELQADALSREEQIDLFSRLAKIDREEFRIARSVAFPYGGGVPCSIRGLGLYIKVNGEVFDCPGESIRLGDLREDDIATIWRRAREITTSFNGTCLPRELFWQRLAESATQPAAL